MTGRERIIRHLSNQPVDHLPCMPITMQFAARYAGVPYDKYATEGRVLAEAQVRVASDFGFDHVSAISDPAREAADLGASVIYAHDTPPAMNGENPLITERTDLIRLLDMHDTCGPRMGDRLVGIRELRAMGGHDYLIEGWIEGPCAEAADLRGISTLMTDFGDDPGFVHDLFGFVLQLELSFAERQIEAGADIIGIGDAAASLVGPRIYEEFVLPYQVRMVQGVHAMGALVRLHICGNTRRVLRLMGATGSDIVDLDYPSPLADGRAAMGPDQVLLGNIDPVQILRNGAETDVYESLAACHAQAGPRYVVGAGCEVTRDTPHENVRALVRYSREHSPLAYLHA